MRRIEIRLKNAYLLRLSRTYMKDLALPGCESQSSQRFIVMFLIRSRIQHYHRPLKSNADQ
ncbi:hypothetical protein ABF87_02180 [Nitrosomonas sp. JL21]|nr:hypothetical protein [Nitrosomonas sp. JL21]